MYIETSTRVPDDTYFRTYEAEPDILTKGICIYNGTGSRRSWGTPGVTSTIVLNDDDFCAIHVGFHHKHGGGQFWRYYTTDGIEIRQLGWKDIPDELRGRILDRHIHTGMGWIKSHGKLRSTYLKPSSKIERTYKLLEVRENGRLFSLYDPDLECHKDIRLVERARKDHQGGFYSHPTAEQVRDLWEQGTLVPDRCYLGAKTLALVACDIGGTIITYGNGKRASTYLTVREIIDTWQYTPELEGVDV